MATINTIQKNTTWAEAATAINNNYATLLAKISEMTGGEEITIKGAPSYLRSPLGSGTATLSPNTFYVFDAGVTNIDISLNRGEDDKTNEYIFQFVGSANTSLSIDDSVVWAEELVIEAGKTYQVSILNGYATFAVFNTKQ